MLRVITPPAIEPVSLIEIKMQARIDHNEEDVLLSQYIKTARQHIEVITRRALITQTLELSLDDWWLPDGLELLMPPLQSVLSITYRDVDGVEAVLDPSSYVVDTQAQPGRIRLKKEFAFPSTELWPFAPVKITYKAGYGDNAESVPEPIRQAIRMLAVHYYENREAVLVERGVNVQALPYAVDALLANYRMWRF